MHHQEGFNFIIVIHWGISAKHHLSFQLSVSSSDQTQVVRLAGLGDQSHLPIPDNQEVWTSHSVIERLTMYGFPATWTLQFAQQNHAFPIVLDRTSEIRVHTCFSYSEIPLLASRWHVSCWVTSSGESSHLVSFHKYTSLLGGVI